MALDAVLALEQPVHGPVELVSAGIGDPEFLAQRVGERLATQGAGGGQLRAGLQDASQDHRGRQGPLAGAATVQQLLEAQAAGTSQRGGDVAMGPGAEDRKVSPREGSATPPFSRMRSPSTRSSGHFDRLASVRFLTLPSSRKDSRSRTAGGEFRFGTRSTYMGIIVTDTPSHDKLIEDTIHGYTRSHERPQNAFSTNGLPRQKAPIPLEVRTRAAGEPPDSDRREGAALSTGWDR